MRSLTALVGRFGRFGWLALGFAALWSAGLIVAAIFAPAYQSWGRGVSSSGGVASSGQLTAGSQTLVAVNGWPVLLVVAVPLAATMLTSGALWLRRERPRAAAAAWVITGLLACINVLALASIGLLMIPATAGLVVACASRGREAGPDATRFGKPWPSGSGTGTAGQPGAARHQA